MLTISYIIESLLFISVLVSIAAIAASAANAYLSQSNVFKAEIKAEIKPSKPVTSKKFTVQAEPGFKGKTRNFGIENITDPKDHGCKLMLKAYLHGYKYVFYKGMKIKVPEQWK